MQNQKCIEFSGFHSGVTEDSVILGYEPVLMGNMIRPFRGKVLISSSRKEMSTRNSP